VREPAPLESLGGDLAAGPFGGEPGLALPEQLAHLGEERFGRRAFALERLDPREPVDHCACLLHLANVARRYARDRAAFATNELLSARVADFETKLAAARRAYEENKPFEALRRLDAARRRALKQRDEERLRRVLDFAEGVIARDERTEIERENVVYAARQNLRQLSRRRVLRQGAAWEDPFPDLEAPRPQTRTFVSGGVKFWIGVGVVLGLLVVAAFVAAVIAGAFDSGDELALRIRNDTDREVALKWCSEVACDRDTEPLSTTHLDPGAYERRDLPAHDIVDLFVVEDADGNRVGCLPVRVDRTYEALADKQLLTVVRVSSATPCPGLIVTPEPAA
jgi:hypothetical protein